uniref:Immunoglobulin domain-containing protein n=1 Tax=Cyprinus carpio TaxID=7962 RepID=A0A8C1UJI0_CYPCA
MKSSFSTELFLLLMCGVFGAETEEGKSVTVKEGDSVTLNPERNQIQGIIKIVWRFGDKGTIIADSSENEPWLSNTDERFRDRLQLNQTSGSLTITDMRTEHSGLYVLQIDRNTGISLMKFNVTVLEPGGSSGAIAGTCVTVLLVAAAAVVYYYRHRICDQNRLMAEEKKESVEEGRSVNLETDTELQRADEIKWWFEDLILTEFRKETSKKDDTDYIECDVADGRFRNKLVLDEKTGTLIINNIRTFHSGLYKLQISRKNRRTEYKRFIVTVTVSETTDE